jgi:hypothetical protein
MSLTMLQYREMTACSVPQLISLASFAVSTNHDAQEECSLRAVLPLKPLGVEIAPFPAFPLLTL